MCGRFSFKTPSHLIADLFTGIAFNDDSPRYNIAPTQPVAAVRADPNTGMREGVELRWGLIPSWAKDPKIGSRMINARCETVAEKPAYRAAFKRRRCLILADGFYEWQKVGKEKIPHYMTLRDEQPFCFAGLWERWNQGDQQIESCTVITTEGNELMQPIHDRMPVILSPDDFDMWLDPTFQNRPPLEQLLKPLPHDLMKATIVSNHVNKVANDDPGCILPA